MGRRGVVIWGVVAVLITGGVLVLAAFKPRWLPGIGAASQAFAAVFTAVAAIAAAVAARSSATAAREARQALALHHRPWASWGPLLEDEEGAYFQNVRLSGEDGALLWLAEDGLWRTAPVAPNRLADVRLPGVKIISRGVMDPDDPTIERHDRISAEQMRLQCTDGATGSLWSADLMPRPGYLDVAHVVFALVESHP